MAQRVIIHNGQVVILYSMVILGFVLMNQGRQHLKVIQHIFCDHHLFKSLIIGVLVHDQNIIKSTVRMYTFKSVYIENMPHFISEIV